MPIENSFTWSTTELGDDLSKRKVIIGSNGTVSIGQQRDAAGEVRRGVSGVTEPNERISIHIGIDVNNTLVLTFVFVFLLIYFILSIVLLIRRWWGGRTPLYVLKWPPKSLKNSSPYIVTIVTGSKSDSGTMATIAFSIHGDEIGSESYSVNGGGIHYDRKLLSRCARDCFLVINDQPLGSITKAKVTLWASNRSDNWYLSYITVWDIRKNEHTYLPFHNWISAEEESGQEKTIEAITDNPNSGQMYLDNLCAGFRERFLWICPWTSLLLGSKLDSFYSFTLCYLTLTALMFTCAAFFSTGAYRPGSGFSGNAFLFVFFLTLTITLLISLLQSAIRMIRLAGRDFVDRFTPVLIRDSSMTFARWDQDSSPSQSPRSADEGSGTATSDERRQTVPRSSYEARPSYEPRPSRQINNSAASEEMLPPRRLIRDRSRDDEVPAPGSTPEEELQRNNSNNRTRSPRNVFPGISSLAKQDQSSCAASGSLSRPGPTKATVTRQPRVGLFSSAACIGGRNVGVTISGRGKTANRRHSMMTGSGVPYSTSKNSSFKMTRAGADRPSQSFGGRSVASKYQSDYNPGPCAKCFAKPSSSECAHSVLTKPEDWRSSPYAPDSRFSSMRAKAYRSDISTKAFGTHGVAGTFDDPFWNLGDSELKEDYVERKFSDGVASTKKLSYPKHSDSVGMFYDYRSGRHRHSGGGRHKKPAPMMSDSFLTYDCARCDFDPFEGHDHHSRDEVEKNWNALWNNVRPLDGECKDDHLCTGASKHPSDLSSSAATELRGFAGKLVESIVCKIKKQLSCPADQPADLTDCEFDVEAFVKTISERAVARLEEKERCMKKDGAQCPDTCSAAPASACAAPAEDALEDRIAKVVASGALKKSLALLDERVTAIVKDVEKVREQIMKRMRQELGLDEAGQGGKTVTQACTKAKQPQQQDTKTACPPQKSACPPPKSASSSSSSLSSSSAIGDTTSCKKKQQTTKQQNPAASIPSDQAAKNMNDTKLAKVARSSIENIFSQDSVDAIKGATAPTAESDLKAFATNVVHSLYAAVRAKLEQLLGHEYGSGGAGASYPFPTEELLKKADHEVKEQVLPTVVEHIVWLMKEEAKVIGQLDCDMMMIAFAGQYVDTIVTNAVLKTNVDLTKKRAYTRTFVVTSNSNKANNGNNNNNNNRSNRNGNNRLVAIVDRCLSEQNLSLETLSAINSTSVKVDDVLRRCSRHSNAGGGDDDSGFQDDGKQPPHQEILFQVLDNLLKRVRRCDRRREDADKIVPDTDAELCPYCRKETILSITARCLTPLWAKLVVDLVLEDAMQNLEECADAVQRNLARCSSASMICLGRSLLDGARQTDEHLAILESVSTELKTMAMERAVEKVVDYLMALGDASRPEVEAELRNKADRFLADVHKNTEKMMLKYAIRANFLENTQNDENVNYNAAAAPPGDDSPPGAGKRRFTTADDLSTDLDHDRADVGGKDDPDQADADSLVDDMIGIRNSLTRIADEDSCLSGRCRRHRGRLSRTLPSGHCEAFHQGDYNTNNEDQSSQGGVDRRTFAHDIDEIEGNTLAELWNDPSTVRPATLLFLANALFTFVFIALASLAVGCLAFGVQLRPGQAIIWLQMTLVALILQVCLFETIKILIIAAYWTLVTKSLMR